MISHTRMYKNRYIAPIPKKLQSELNLEAGDSLDLTWKVIKNPRPGGPKLEVIINRIIKDSRLNRE